MLQSMGSDMTKRLNGTEGKRRAGTEAESYSWSRCSSRSF